MIVQGKDPEKFESKGSLQVDFPLPLAMSVFFYEGHLLYQTFPDSYKQAATPFSFLQSNSYIPGTPPWVLESEIGMQDGNHRVTIPLKIPKLLPSRVWKSIFMTHQRLIYYSVSPTQQFFLRC